MNVKKMKKAGIVLVAGAVMLQHPIGVSVLSNRDGPSSSIVALANELAPIRFSNSEPAGVNTTLFGWSVGTHPGHNQIQVAMQGEGWRVEVHAHSGRPWEIVAIGNVPEDTVFWLYFQAESRNSIGGDASSWTSRQVYRMQVIVNGEGRAEIPLPDTLAGGYQIKLGDPRFDDHRNPTFPMPDLDDVNGVMPELDVIEEDEDDEEDYYPVVPLPDEVDLGDWSADEESDDTFYDIDPEGVTPELDLVEDPDREIIVPDGDYVIATPLPDEVDLDEEEDPDREIIVPDGDYVIAIPLPDEVDLEDWSTDEESEVAPELDGEPVAVVPSPDGANPRNANPSTRNVPSTPANQLSNRNVSRGLPQTGQLPLSLSMLGVGALALGAATTLSKNEEEDS